MPTPTLPNSKMSSAPAEVNILTSPDSIEIATGPLNQNQTTTPTTTVPFLTHAFADESLAQPPLSRIDKVLLADCWGKTDQELFMPEEYRYKPPPALTITNDDGSAITLGQFVSHVHAYLNTHMEEVKKVKGEMYGKLVTKEDGRMVREITYGESWLPPDISFFFSQVYAMLVGEEVWVSVKVFAEGEFGWDVDRFWEIMGAQARLWGEGRREGKEEG
ncbi:hypothetical protein CC80DRAFT_598496 [Byssothecium circinans]|uniref:Uncharacterized protein n=1 Tax=Byssothecium circinans TaxID=147558 RepID=A0A6A5TAV7_9PLEO|nr:hypothetical protein CC80DRAFT_598496 [Byssothecium circinans]